MKLSLEKLSRELGDKRRELKDSHEALVKSTQEADVLEDKLTSARQELEGIINGLSDGEEPPKDKVEAVEKMTAEFKSTTSANDAASVKLSGLTEEINDLQSKFDYRKSLNDMDDFLQSSAGRSGYTVGAINDPAGVSSAAGVRVLPESREAKEHNLGLMIQAHVLSQIDHTSPEKAIADLWGQDSPESAMVAGEHSKGGSFVFGSYADFWIELLAQKAVVRMMGVPTVPIEDGSLTIPAITDGIVGGYMGETEDTPVDEFETGDITLNAKECGALVPMSRKLLRSRSARALEMIRNELVKAVARIEDRAFLRGPESGPAPTGMRYRAGHIKSYNGASATDVNVITQFLGWMETLLEESHVEAETPCWVGRPTLFNYLATLRDGNGNLVFDEINNGMLRGKPIHKTTHIPGNLANATLGLSDLTELFLLDAAKQVIGDAPGIGMEASTEGTYVQNGVVHSLFQKRQVGLQLTEENDFHTRYPESIVVATDIPWKLEQP